ncbi:aldehyde ferredoxin oxidoreductase family protein [Desulfosudis oleivorans]|uniref:Aldehyde ferredoxin oxidoreductase n=1 Tax=Desulfosudis oleivorans (strain DSM 6200 / JCM 39069 / Hxd3) TaxID=96561 RepID=A8ZW71_DESOH|nr:aldehyde ferredoxin oxidoreductase C-terminal domain-containing protein [Desulfosudis oleivorans]ABW68305.1 Aldehyde ferredoxin oxidoreductase [Desulfosudis oleivorans Hxd3]
MAKILRINTKNKTATFETPSDEYKNLGGRALTSKIVLREVPGTCHPLSRDNKLIFAPGMLTGTPAANSGRMSVGAKSPLTGGIKESNTGGIMSQKLARLGIQAIILEDKPDDDAYSIIVITKDSVEFLPANEYLGVLNGDMMPRLWERFGKHVGVASIGPAGEQRLTSASIQFADPKGHAGRAAGRGGLGAVMGSKKIKAIVVNDTDTDRPSLHDPEAFKTANKKWGELLTGHPVSGNGLPAYGTAVLVNIINEAGALPTKNFRSGRFDHAQDISGETLSANIEKRGGIVSEGCHPGCVIKCSQCYHDKDGNFLTSGFEYETIWAFGAHCLIKDLDDIAMLDRLCDDFGLDTIETGVTMGIAMEGGLIPWGDGKAAIELLKKVGTGEPMGKIIGNGAAFTGQALGVDRIPVVKRQALPAYDPRAVKAVGVTYATSPMGADHTAGYGVCQNILHVGGTIDPLKKEFNVGISKDLQVATAAIDAAGLCLFVAFPVLDDATGLQLIVDMLNAQSGLSLTTDDVVALGISILKDEHEFNRLAGFTQKDDRLPDMFKETFPPHNTTWDFTDAELQEAKTF